MQQTEMKLAIQEWVHWSNFWRRYLVGFVVALLAIGLFGYIPEFKTIGIGLFAGISIFVRAAFEIHKRLIASSFATLGAIVPVIIFSPKVVDAIGGLLFLFSWFSITGITVAILYGAFGHYYYPNNVLQGTPRDKAARLP